MTNYRFTSPALVELREATLRYEEQQKGLGAEFLGEIDATVDRILRFPRMASVVCANTALPKSSISLRTALSNSAR